MRFQFDDEELQEVYEQPDAGVARFGRDLVRSYRKKVGVIAGADSELDLRAMRSLRFEKLIGSRAGQHSIRLNQQWRLIVEVSTGDQGPIVTIIEIVDYH